MKDMSKAWNSRGAGSMGHKNNSMALPDGRNSGQKQYQAIEQTCKPAPGSPTPTQSSKQATGRI